MHCTRYYCACLHAAAKAANTLLYVTHIVSLSLARSPAVCTKKSNQLCNPTRPDATACCPALLPPSHAELFNMQFCASHLPAMWCCCGCSMTLTTAAAAAAAAVAAATSAVAIAAACCATL
eukprot:6915-Heterococcus_DN1.PRE.1